MAELPTGTVTFLFIDIEGSTRRWEEQPDEVPSTLSRAQRRDDGRHRVDAADRHRGARTVAA